MTLSEGEGGSNDDAVDAFVDAARGLVDFVFEVVGQRHEAETGDGLQEVEVLPSRVRLPRFRHQSHFVKKLGHASFPGVRQIVFLFEAERSVVGLQLDEEGVFAVRGEREEIGLVRPFGAALAERKLGDEPGIDLDAAWRQMPVEGLRQEQPKKDVSARFEPVGRQMPPVVEMVEQGIDVWSSHEKPPVGGDAPCPLPVQPQQRDVLKRPWRHDRLPRNTPYFCRHPVQQTKPTSRQGNEPPILRARAVREDHRLPSLRMAGR